MRNAIASSAFVRSNFRRGLSGVDLGYVFECLFDFVCSRMFMFVSA